jgi:hypothetical protein
VALVPNRWSVLPVSAIFHLGLSENRLSPNLMVLYPSSHWISNFWSLPPCWTIGQSPTSGLNTEKTCSVLQCTPEKHPIWRGGMFNWWWIFFTFCCNKSEKKIVAVQRPLLPNLEHFYNPIPDDFPAYQRVRYGKIHHFPGFSQIFPYFSIFVNRILPFLSHIFRPRFPLPLSPSRHLRRHQDWRSGGAGTAVRDCVKLMVNKRQ